MPGLTRYAEAEGFELDEVPSMEGRAIARPDLDLEAGDVVLADILQWRAGQLPGLTRSGWWSRS